MVYQKVIIPFCAIIALVDNASELIFLSRFLRYAINES